VESMLRPPSTATGIRILDLVNREPSARGFRHGKFENLSLARGDSNGPQCTDQNAFLVLHRTSCIYRKVPALYVHFAPSLSLYHRFALLPFTALRQLVYCSSLTCSIQSTALPSSRS